jgi:hypothetical protein
LFVRAKNNKSSFFQRLPNAILEKSILPFVTTEVCEHQQTIAARAAYLPKLYSWYRQNRKLSSQEETKRMPNLLCRARDYLAGSQQPNDLLAQGLDRIFPPVPCSTDEAQQNPDASKKLK